jgi:hypothetical protein
MVSSIIFGVLGLLVILGLGKFVLKDFRFGAMFAVVFLALVIGLYWVPVIRFGAFHFRLGAMIFYLGALVMFFVYGRLSSQLTALAIALILGAVAFASTRLAMLGVGGFFADTNAVYAILIGILAVLFTKNGKYSFIVSAVAMMFFNLLVQIGHTPVLLHHGFGWTAVAVATSAVLHSLWARVACRPSKMSYYFEVGRLED